MLVSLFLSRGSQANQDLLHNMLKDVICKQLF